MRRSPASFLGAVTFDVTGTLIHCPRLGEIYREVLTKDGIHMAETEIRRLFVDVWHELDCRVPSGSDRFQLHPGGPRGFWAELLERVCRLAGQPSPSPLAAERLYHAFTAADAWEVFPEVPGVLETLRGADLRLAVVSNWDERLPALLAELDLDRFFDTLAISQLEGVAKPSPALFRLAADRLGLPPARVLHVGDSQRLDVEGARAAGMQALLLQRGDGSSDLRDLEGLLAHLSAISRDGGPVC